MTQGERLAVVVVLGSAVIWIVALAVRCLR